MADWSTAVTMVHIRLQGAVGGRLDVAAVGSPDAVATLMIGSSLIRIADRTAAARITATWRDAVLNLHHLPEQIRTPLPDPSHGVGLVAQFAGDVHVRQDVSPAQAAGRRAYLRIQTGPLVWGVLDRAAYWATRRIWEAVEDQL